MVAVKPRDEQAPTVDLRTPAEGAQYALGEQVAARLLVRRRGRLGPGVVHGRRARRRPADTATPGDHAFTVVARDGAGNETTVTHHYTVVAAPDEQAPTVDLRHAAGGRAVRRGRRRARADYSCADEGGSGLASCTGDVPDGDPLNTATPGAHDFTVVARDGAGHETTVTHSYTVVEPPPPPPDLGFAGFFGPIHDGSVVRAGDAIPIVFSLGGYHGLDVLADGSPSSVQVDCDDPGARDRRRAGPQRSPAAACASTAGPATTSSSGRPGRRGREPAAPSCWACATAASQRLTVSFRSSWRWHRHR